MNVKIIAFSQTGNTRSGWLTGAVTFLAALAGTVDLVLAALFVHA